MNRKSLLLMLLFLLIGFFLIYLNQFNGEKLDNQQGRVKLYFATKDAMYLQAEQSSIESKDNINIYKETIKELIDGPESKDLTATIPQGVKLNKIEIKGDTAYLDFNRALVENHWGGSTGEIMTVYSIVNTMTQFSAINSVKILIENKEVESLAGHLDLSVAMERDEKLIKER